jgi:hypothetical protein
LGPLALLLRDFKVGVDVFPFWRNRKALVKAFNRLLRQKLCAVHAKQDSESKTLGILPFLLDDQVLIDLQKSQYPMESARPRREPVQRDKLLEERDKLIYEAWCEGKTLSEIRGLVREKYPRGQYPGLRRVKESRIWQIVYEYAERHGLPKPKPRQRRGG